MGLSRRQRELLEFLKAHFRDHGFAPSYSEIGAAIGLKSKSRVEFHIAALEEFGLVRRLARHARGLQLLQTCDYHAADCDCGECARLRYLADLRLVQALQVSPPVALVSKLVGLRPLSHARRIEWLGLQRKSSVRQSAPKMSPAKVG